jgi:hypothetical protein
MTFTAIKQIANVLFLYSVFKQREHEKIENEEKI